MARNDHQCAQDRLAARARKLKLTIDTFMDYSQKRRETLAEAAGALGRAEAGRSLILGHTQDIAELQCRYEYSLEVRDKKLMPSAGSWAHGTPVSLYTHKEIGPHFNAQGAPISTSGAALLELRHEEVPEMCDGDLEDYRRYLLDKIIKRNTAKAVTP